MTSFKTYAKQAKQRLRNNFWQEVILERNQFKQKEQDGENVQSLLVRQKQEIREKLYNNNFESDEQFYARVKQLLSTDQIVTNPIAVLTDEETMQQMSEHQKQAYLLKLSNRYQQAVERYYRENSVS